MPAKRNLHAVRLISRHVIMAVAGLLCSTMIPQTVSAERPQLDLERGRAEYLRSCARCHGVNGAGDGLDAKRFYPRPRDFSFGTYKFRSTASGTPPTDEDLFSTVTRGLPGSNMPAWNHLDEELRWQLVYYMKSLSTFFEEVEPEPVEVAPDPGAKRADLARGRVVYEQLQCAACHGPNGRANGPSAAGLEDDWEMPIRPSNLTQGWSYRGWSDPQSVMLRFLTGIDGAGMPSYLGAVSPEDAWQLAYYVESLQEEPRWNRIARATRIDGALPGSPDDPRWALAERTDVRLRNVVRADGTWASAPTVNLVSVEVVYIDDAVAFRLTWDDPTADREASPDALTLLLKPRETVGDVVTLQAWPYVGSPALDQWYWAADANNAYEAVAAAYVHGSAVQTSTGAIGSAARYDDGRWQVVLQRPLQRSSPRGVAAINVEVDRVTAVAFAVWDGAHPDERAVSAWLEIAWKPLEPTAH